MYVIAVNVASTPAYSLQNILEVQHWTVALRPAAPGRRLNDSDYPQAPPTTSA